MKLFDFHHPFFAPLWIRLVIFAVCVCWAMVEFSHGALFWGGIFLGFAAIAGWQFFVRPADHWNGPPGQD